MMDRMASRSRSEQGQADAGREAWVLMFRMLQANMGAVQAVWRQFELTGPQAHLLQRLGPDEMLPMNGLAGALDCQPSNVTGLVDKLEARGLIERRSEPGDRRVKMIALTAAGRRFRAQLLERLSEPPPFITSLSAEDKGALLQLLQRAAAKLMSSDPGI